MTGTALKEDEAMVWERFYFVHFSSMGLGFFQDSQDLNLAPGNLSTHCWEVKLGKK